MSECSNFHCGAHTWNKHIRCANCRRRDINLCCDCDAPTTRRALYCDDCRMNHRATMLKVFHESRKADYPECRMCFKTLENRKQRYCKGFCTRLYLSLDRGVRREIALQKK